MLKLSDEGTFMTLKKGYVLRIVDERLENMFTYSRSYISTAINDAVKLERIYINDPSGNFKIEDGGNQARITIEGKKPRLINEWQEVSCFGTILPFLRLCFKIASLRILVNIL